MKLKFQQTEILLDSICVPVVYKDAFVYAEVEFEPASSGETVTIEVDFGPTGVEQLNLYTAHEGMDTKTIAVEGNAWITLY